MPTAQRPNAQTTNMGQDYTDRQLRELEYHRERAQRHRHLVDQLIDYQVVLSDTRRWWNPYWALYTYLRGLPLKGRRVLVVGCGFGEDAIRIARLGAIVSGFDLSSESIEIARGRAERESLRIDLQVCPAERLNYADDTFDVVLAHDILHHCDVPRAVGEMCRVVKSGGLLVVSEVYSHSVTEYVRRSALVERVVYPLVRKIIYRNRDPYITADERKMNERDMNVVMAPMTRIVRRDYFNFLVQRIFPEHDWISKLDRSFMRATPFLGPLLGGRVLVAGLIEKRQAAESISDNRQEQAEV